MDAHLFTCGENILLIGEGNFSFTVGLERLNWSLKITSSCYEAHDLGLGESLVEDFTLSRSRSTKNQNIKHLESRGVRVLLGVDGTQLSKHPILGSEQFSKIIFNFPHVGGKMKIHLNRCLLRDFFKSATSLLEPGGRVLVSLCKGQGGTAADGPHQRRWDDTWQVAEMAAHADLVLTGVEPFRQSLVPDYSSVGYRSRDTSFHTDGALVHVFSRANPIFPDAFTCHPSALLQCLEYQSIETNFGKVTCSSIYAVKYNCNPADIDGSPVHYLLTKLNVFAENQLKSSELSNCNIKHISDMEVPLHVEVCDGLYVCEKKGQIVHCELRPSLLDAIGKVLPFWLKRNEETVFFSGLVFNKLNSNFSIPPLSNHVLMLGNNVCSLGSSYVQHMLTLVEDCPFESFLEKGVEPCEMNASICNSDILETSSMSHIVLSTSNTNDQCKESVIVGEELTLILKQNNELVTVPCSLIYLDKLALVLFKLCNWRELWAKGVHLVNKGLGLPLLKLPSLYPRSFTFDICFGSEGVFDCESFYDILWQVAGDIVTKIELLNLYESPDGWKSSCYRVVYQSFDKALHRGKVIAIHQNIVGRTVCEKLGVSTS